MRCSRCSTIRELGSRKPWICVPERSASSPAQVTLFGKGRKERVCPLWPETADLLTALLKRQPRLDDQPIFVNRCGEPLGAAGVRFKLKAYVRMAARCTPSLAHKHVTPHTFRHSMGVFDGGRRCRHHSDPQPPRARELGHDEPLRPCQY